MVDERGRHGGGHQEPERHLTGEARRLRPPQQFTHRRAQAVCSDEEIAGGSTTLGEAGRDAIVALCNIDEAPAQPDGAGPWQPGTPIEILGVAVIPDDRVRR